MVRHTHFACILLCVFSALVLAPLALSAQAAPGRAPSNVIHVFPGPKAIRKALKQAAPGDILNLHAGTYNEKFAIKIENLTVKSAGDGPVIIDAQCNSVATIDIRAEGAVVRGLTVQGGTFFAINLEHIASGLIKNNTVLSTCSGAEYGINVFDGGSIKVIGNQGRGWNDAVVYIGGINETPTGPLVVKKNNTYRSVRGIIIEDSSNVDIRVIKNNAHNNSLLGIFVHNADNILISGNTVTDNASIGLHLDSTSDDNQIRDNLLSGNTTDIQNNGSNNCFEGNTYSTSIGPINTCP